MSADISLLDLLNLSIGTPEVGAVNFNALHSLLHAILGHLKIQNVTTHWREENPPPQEPHGQTQAKALLRELPGPYHQIEDKLRKIELKMSALEKLPNGAELMNLGRTESSATPVSDMWQQMQLRRQVQANADGVSKVRRSSYSLISQCIYDSCHLVKITKSIVVRTITVGPINQDATSELVWCLAEAPCMGLYLYSPFTQAMSLKIGRASCRERV